MLGPPAIELDGQPTRSPRGRKAWALLSYLLLAERPPSRRHVAELLFADADDPLGALRWTLAELRRVLGGTVTFVGDPVTTAVGDGIAVDVHGLADPDGDPAPLLALDGELLEGVSLPACLEFESWLLVARHRVSATLEARLRQTAVALLASGAASEAVGYAARAVARNPLEEGNHELLVRSLAVAGDRAAALRQIAVGEDLLRRELGHEASAALREAANVGPESAMVTPLSGRAAALSQMEAGRAAIAAGAVDAGLQCLRRAVTEASRAATARYKGGRSVRSGVPLYTRYGGGTTRGQLSWRRRSIWPAGPVTGPRRSPRTGCSASSRCRPAGGVQPRRGWPRPSRWRRPTPSWPRSSAYGG
ncbi:BTAD domain-containing putative transcriptional regulator [Phytohabitans flavus]|uniref:AfsR/SARP family transcriptional regulator n=1 Tax=Phytohabitans flavus TaxID=1076124 RepID=UPI00363220DE